VSRDRRDLWRCMEGGKKSGIEIDNSSRSHVAPKDHEIDDREGLRGQDMLGR
jgi:hypothetical protein